MKKINSPKQIQARIVNISIYLGSINVTTVERSDNIDQKQNFKSITWHILHLFPLLGSAWKLETQT